MGNPITDMQETVAEVLAADPGWNSIPVITEQIDNIQNRIDTAVGKVNGICTLVVSPVAGVGKDRLNMPLYFDGITVVVRTFEKPVLNKTGIRCLDATLAAMALLHHKPLANGIIETLNATKYQLGRDPKWFCYDAYFTTMGGILYDVPKLSDPVIAETSPGVFTITPTAQPGAATFWSYTNASQTTFLYPNPRQGTLYTGPVSVTPPCTIYCRTWLPGFLPSNYVKQSFAT